MEGNRKKRRKWERDQLKNAEDHRKRSIEMARKLKDIGNSDSAIIRFLMNKMGLSYQLAKDLVEKLYME